MSKFYYVYTSACLSAFMEVAERWAADVDDDDFYHSKEIADTCVRAGAQVWGKIKCVSERRREILFKTCKAGLLTALSTSLLLWSWHKLCPLGNLGGKREFTRHLMTKQALTTLLFRQHTQTTSPPLTSNAPDSDVYTQPHKTKKSSQKYDEANLAWTNHSHKITHRFLVFLTLRARLPGCFFPSLSSASLCLVKSPVCCSGVLPRNGTLKKKNGAETRNK